MCCSGLSSIHVMSTHAISVLACITFFTTASGIQLLMRLQVSVTARQCICSVLHQQHNPPLHASDTPMLAFLTHRESKLCLVLDLDHTLVNSARFSEVSEPMLALIEQQLAEQERLPPEQRLLHCLPHISMWTKLRPAVRLFLQRAAQFFQLWIHTNGNR